MLAPAARRPRLSAEHRARSDCGARDPPRAPDEKSSNREGVRAARIDSACDAQRPRGHTASAGAPRERTEPQAAFVADSAFMLSAFCLSSFYVVVRAPF